MENKGKKNKGNNFERVISKRIGEWWCDDPDAFWRTAGSGSRAHKVQIHPGDIGPIKQIDQPFPFCIECRNRESWSLDEIMKSKVPDLLTWTVKNSEVDAGDDYLSFLIVKRNFYPSLIVYPTWDMKGKDCALTPRIGIFIGQEPVLFIAHLDQFLDVFGPNFWKEISSGEHRRELQKKKERAAVERIKAYLNEIRSGS